MGENTMDQVHLLGNGLLWLPEDGRNRITLVDVSDRQDPLRAAGGRRRDPAAQRCRLLEPGR
jgi:hypothetical protein